MKTAILTTDTVGHMVAVAGFNFLLWPSTIDILKQYDRIITLGTPIIRPDMLNCGPEWLNIHGGNPEYYRGLDSHLWAIYHNDWKNIVTTLHYIDEGIDTGDIVFQCQIPIKENLYLENMKVCNKLITIATLSQWLPRRKQVRKGQYYGAMPDTLRKEVNEKLFRFIGK